MACSGVSNKKLKQKMYFDCVQLEILEALGLWAKRKRLPRFIVRPLQAEIKRGRSPGDATRRDATQRFKASVRESVFPAHHFHSRTFASDSQPQTERAEQTNSNSKLAKAKLLFLDVATLPRLFQSRGTQRQLGIC